MQLQKGDVLNEVKDFKKSYGPKVVHDGDLPYWEIFNEWYKKNTPEGRSGFEGDQRLTSISFQGLV